MSPPASPTSSAPASGSGSPKRKGKDSPLFLDLSSLPALVQPSPPSNTLLITNLNNPSLFLPPSLSKIRAVLSSQTPLNSFAPLRSFHRIIISYPSISAAISTRQLLDGSSTRFLLAQNADTSCDDDSTEQNHYDRIRCYFGEPTPVAGEEHPDQHLKAPSSGKLFFISPPPSPPSGWESREEDPPNRETHAADLQNALVELKMAHARATMTPPTNTTTTTTTTTTTAAGERRDSKAEGTDEGPDEDVESRRLAKRARSMTVYHPKDHGSKEDLPAVVVSAAGEGEEEEEEGGDEEVLVDADADVDVHRQERSRDRGKRVITHTSRPPVESMEE